MEQIFFRALYALMADKQVIKITTTRVGDNISLLINKDNKLITMTGNPEEVDNGIIDHLKVNAEAKEQEFNFTVQDAPESNDDEKTPASKTKKTGKSSAKKKSPAAKVKPAPKEKPKKKGNPKAKDIPREPDTEPANNKQAEQEAKEKLKAFTSSMDLGAKHLKAKNYQEAIGTFENAVSLATEGNTAAAEKLQQAKEALANEQKQKEFDQLMELGKKQREERKYEDSLETFKKAQEIFPGNAEIIKQVASAEKWIKALSELEE